MVIIWIYVHYSLSHVHCFLSYGHNLVSVVHYFLCDGHFYLWNLYNFLSHADYFVCYIINSPCYDLNLLFRFKVSSPIDITPSVILSISCAMLWISCHWCIIQPLPSIISKLASPPYFFLCHSYNLVRHFHNSFNYLQNFFSHLYYY